MYLNKWDTGSGLHYLERKSKEIIVKFVDVIIPLAVEGVFTYVVPEILEEKIREGVLVIVPLWGIRNIRVSVPGTFGKTARL